MSSLTYGIGVQMYDPRLSFYNSSLTCGVGVQMSDQRLCYRPPVFLKPCNDKETLPDPQPMEIDNDNNNDNK